MQGCVQCHFFSILLNGMSKSSFKSSRGLQQGNPLSSFLFSIVTDGLSALSLKEEKANLIRRYMVGNSSQTISHLQFVDDTICFLDADENAIGNFGICLKIFELI